MSDYDGSAATLERAEDIEKNPAGEVKRWLLEIKLADKRENEWKKKARKVWDRYRQKDAKRNSFNILWSNTETLRPAVYNSLPKPDVRRRFKDADPMGKACSEVLGRALEYGLDVTDFDSHIKATVLDMLLPGRGVARVRYVPTLAQVGVTAEAHEEENEQHPDEAGEALEGDAEELQWEQAPIEHVQWDDFRCGPGKEWGEVPWVSFDHRLTRDELVEQFGDVGELVSLDNADDEDVREEKDEKVQQAFKTALVHEIWCKSDGYVLFIAPGYKDKPLLKVADPLNLQGFFPIPRPLYAVEDSASLVPTPLYELYKEQADELDAVSARINRIIKGLKLRGVYDSTLSELSELMRGEDNDFIPAANVTALLERGGLDKAIWTTGNLIQTAAVVLKELYVQRDQCKQVIYEITGISDILRGSTNASETATAQNIKAQWGSQRLKRIQSEVARFIRDLMRMQGEIIAEKFQPETLKGMTGLNFPMMAEKQQAMLQWQQQAQQAQMQGQQPPQQPQLPPAWEEIIQVLRDDAQRTFKVDIETESTVAASIDQDMQGLQQVTQAIGVVMKEMMPLVQANAMPLEAAKELLLNISRRSKFGNAFEDALDKMQQPPPQGNPEQAKAQAQAQVEQMKMQQEGQLEQMRLQMEERARQAELQSEMKFRAMQEQMIAEREERKMEREAMLAHQQMMQEQAFERFKALLEARTKVEVAEISAGATLDAAQISAANQGTDNGSV